MEDILLYVEEPVLTPPTLKPLKLLPHDDILLNSNVFKLETLVTKVPADKFLCVIILLNST